tara:strand:+ start:87 stop:839 length:753 start_codon:yes stop_codon:yes gene_type:complete
MISLNQIKFLRSLELKKYRSIENQVLLDGKRLIHEAIKQQINIQHIWISNNNKINNNFIKNIELNNIEYSFEKDKSLNKISNTKNSQGILALISTKNMYNSDLKKFNNKIIILDQISDPGNLGTIIRTCAWFGVKSIILTKNSADIFNYKCIRSSVGGHFYIKNLTYLSYEEICEYILNNDYSILCADKNGTDINKIQIDNNWVLILGSEAHGINEKLNFDSKVSIKGKGKIESLNVSVAAGILLSNLMK